MTDLAEDLTADDIEALKQLVEYARRGDYWLRRQWENLPFAVQHWARRT